MKNVYDNERANIIKTLEVETSKLAIEIEKERAHNGFTAQYRALSKTYNDATKHYLNLLKEAEAESAEADALAEFNAPFVYSTDKRD